MTTYSVADARNGLPRLIDQALEGEQVVITRHGKPVVEIRALEPPTVKDPKATYAWLKERRDARPWVDISSVELLRQIYEEPDI